MFKMDLDVGNIDWWVMGRVSNTQQSRRLHAVCRKIEVRGNSESGWECPR